MAGHMLGERLLLFLLPLGLVVCVVDHGRQPYPRRRGYLGLDLCQHAFNSRGAGLHGCWSSRAQRLSCREPLGRQSRPCGLRVALASGSQGTPALCPSRCRYGHRPDCRESHPPSQGEFVPGFETSAWGGIGAPRDTPTEIVDKLNREINAALTDPKMKARFADLRGTVLALSPAEYGKRIAEETEKWGKVIKFSGAKAD